ncbi:hypothetical protein [Paludisphaera borealis]|uniref:Glycosyl transferase family 28 C-terminal domain-containing protein n=1 Tax=Paludisphaera borealis TaxID=1387353 RepID=A0A1U7CTQ9_9BACT|nr:hypothetical protein [Paludisphaera borealis]APW62324.1 hypothetical protein BSF38_03863 [Paludisphaera borealis]
MAKRQSADPRAKQAGGALIVHVTSHGFGHLNRTVAVINQVPVDVPVVIRSHPDLFPNWRERLLRPAELVPHASDAGAVNPAGGSGATDAAATLERALRVHNKALFRLDDDVAYLQAANAGAVLCDAPPLPLVAARRAGVPGFLLANFTWYDIYEPYARSASADAKRLVADYREAYRQAEGVFRAEPALKMSWLPNQIDVGLVANPGRDRSKELRKLLGLGEAEKLVYFYIGRYGQDDLDWERLGSYARRGVHFVGYHAAPVGTPANLHLVSASEWSGGDLIASTDAVVAKAGYGTVSEAMAHGRPILYPPRQGFSEYRALDRALRAWGGGVPLSSRDFAGMRLDRALDRAFQVEPLKSPYPVDGAATVARRLTEVCRPAGTPARRADSA